MIKYNLIIFLNKKKPNIVFYVKKYISLYNIKHAKYFILKTKSQNIFNILKLFTSVLNYYILHIYVYCYCLILIDYKK